MGEVVSRACKAKFFVQRACQALWTDMRGQRVHLDGRASNVPEAAWLDVASRAKVVSSLALRSSALARVVFAYSYLDAKSSRAATKLRNTSSRHSSSCAIVVRDACNILCEALRYRCATDVGRSGQCGAKPATCDFAREPT